MLRSLYRQFTGSKIDCPRYGHHWEDIGFQVTKDILLDQQIARHFMSCSECLSNPPSLLKSSISTNHDKGLGF